MIKFPNWNILYFLHDHFNGKFVSCDKLQFYHIDLLDLELIFPFIALALIDGTMYFNVQMGLHCIYSADFLELAEYGTDFFSSSELGLSVHVQFMQSWPAFSSSADGHS